MRITPRAVAIVLLAAAVLGFVGLLLLLSFGSAGNIMVTAARFDALRSDHTALRGFLARMPKGADLHVHLSGAVFAEDLIAWGTAYKDADQQGLCVRLSDLRIVVPPCDEEARPPLASTATNQALYDRLVNAFSMRSFVPSAAVPSGHDQFFATFGKVGELTWRITPLMIAERLHHYAVDQVQHTELMLTLLNGKYMPQFLRAIDGIGDPAERLKALSASFEGPVQEAIRLIDSWDAAVNEALRCKQAAPDPGCNVSYRYIAQINRNAEEASVFAQTAFAAALVRAYPRVAGLNFVGPEDYRVAREDYRRHMAAIGFLADDVPVALHAGELWIGLVPPDDLTFHIREAVEVAGARRIGHGVALAYERRSDQLLDLMRQKGVAVEINLTSNDVILGVRGKDHPLTAYRAARVPVVLSTDDAGISRIDLANEYFRAARDYPLGYRALKRIARDSIAHSFLDAAAKQQAHGQIDRAFAAFEQEIAGDYSVWSNLVAVITGWFRSR